jgi:hypothetical protein
VRMRSIFATGRGAAHAATLTTLVCALAEKIGAPGGADDALQLADTKWGHS